ncbi:MAG: hypothetical protein WBG37_18005 [Desulfobacterales bacterium]|jgi:hypothetical protein
MGHDFIDDLLTAVSRVVAPNVRLLREVLIIGGMPGETQNMHYLSYNSDTTAQEGRSLTFSAVAVINNRRVVKWRLVGYRQKLSQIVFDTRWTRNPLDLFVNNLRCDEAVMDIMDAAPTPYTLLGILQVEELEGAGVRRRKIRRLRPVVAVPRLSSVDLQKIADFEVRNEIRRMKIRGLPVYRKSRPKTASS